MSENSPSRKHFIAFWLGQSLSLICSGLTAFSVNIWYYQNSKSLSMFGILLLVGILPAILCSPFAGVLADRVRCRTIVLVSDSIAGLSTVTMLALLYADQLSLMWVLIFNFVIAAAGTFQTIAYHSSVKLWVGEEFIQKANGMIQSAHAGSQLLVPILAGFLFVSIGIKGILVIDIISFFVAVAVLFFIRFPDKAIVVTDMGSKLSENARSFVSNMKEGIKVFFSIKEIMMMTAFVAMMNLLFGIVQVLFTPYMLTHHSESKLGMLMTIGGVGALVGSLALIYCRNLKHRSAIMVFAGVFSGLCLMSVGVTIDPILLGVAIFVFFVASQLIDILYHTNLQSKVPEAVLGRVYAVKNVVLLITGPIAYLATPKLIDWVFKPMTEQSDWAFIQNISANSSTMVPEISIAFLFVGGAVVLLCLFSLGGLILAALGNKRTVQDDKNGLV